MQRMGLQYRTLIILCASLLALGFAFEASATDVTLRLVDQNGALILASQFVIQTPPGGTVQNGGTISLSDGIYSIRLFPGLNGSLQASPLYRDETVTVSGSAQTLDFVWATATLQLNLVDQNNVLIPASQFNIDVTNILNASSIILPVTEDPLNPPIGGAYAIGYPIRVFPGINGQIQGSALYRDEPAEELAAAGLNKTFVWVTSSVQLNLVDQNNVPIPASQMNIPFTNFSAFLSNGGSVVLPVTEDPNTVPIVGNNFANGYNIGVYPGLNGILQGGALYRIEPAEELTTGGLVKTFVWVTSSVQLNLVDQNNVPIPASQMNIPFTNFSAFLSNGGSVVLPVTEDPNTVPIVGNNFANGYNIGVYPGLNGILQGGALYRVESAEELTTGGLVKTFVWVTSSVQLHLVDQSSILIPASSFSIAGTYLTTNSASIVLPVTEDPNAVPILGNNYSNGYDVRIYPGINGNLQGSPLHRLEAPVELTGSGLIRNFTWEIASGALDVIDVSVNQVIGASINQNFIGRISTGVCVSLPITDNTLYPTIAGTYVNGYNDFYLQTASANPFEGPFTFKFLSNKVIDPAFVTLASGQHGLRFDLMTPTTLAAHAGSDQTINTGQSVQLGGSPTATGGSGSYTISWSPEDGLDDPTAANPMASPSSTTTYTVTVIDNAAGCQATDEVTVQVNHVDPIKPFVFLANKITLKRTKQRTPAGDMHANGTITIEKGDPSTYNSNLTAVGNVVIQKDNTINGNVKSATKITNQGQITGTKTVAPVDNEPLPSKSFSAGGANRAVPKNGTVSLLPGSYGVVTLNNSSMLKLTSGEYFLNELRYSSSVSSAVIEIDLSSRNPVTINVVNNLQLGNEVEIRLLPNGESDSELVTFFTLQNSAMKLGREAYLLGSFNAPNALVTLEKNSQLRGAISAKELLVERDCLFLHHDSPGNLPGPGDLPKSSSDDDEQQATSNEQPVTSYQLEQNYPNPFNPSTKISFALPEASEVTLAIYNNSGQLVRMLISGQKAAGRHSVVWDAKDGSGMSVASGIYLYMLKAGSFVAQRKMILMR